MPDQEEKELTEDATKLKEETLEKECLSEEAEDSYGWKFHRVPLLIAAIITAIFYILVFIFVKT